MSGIGEGFHSSPGGGGGGGGGITEGQLPGLLGDAEMTARLSRAFWWDDCESAITASSAPYVLLASGAGAGVSTFTASDTSTAPGQSEYTTGTTATGRIGARTSASAFQLSGGTDVATARLRFPVLSNVTERYAFIMGFHSTPAALDQLHGCYFEYDEGGVAVGGAASPNWTCVTSDSSVRTRTGSGVAVNGATFQKLRIEVNAAGTSVGFFIDGTLVATHTTNIPITAARRLAAGYHMFKSAGVTPTTVIVDFHAHDVRCPAR